MKERLLVIAMALLLGIFLYWPALTNPNQFSEDWRQSPHWLAPEKQFFQSNDLLIRYAEFNTSPFANFMYKNLAKTGHDIIWGKINTLLFFVVTVYLLFLIGYKLKDRKSAWFGIIIYCFFPSIFSEFSGGYMSVLSAVFLCLTLLIILYDKWLWVIPLLIFEAYAYPMAAIHSGFIFGGVLLTDHWKDFRNLNAWKNKGIPLIIGGILAMGVIGAKYISINHEFGILFSRFDDGSLLEFNWLNHWQLDPVLSLWFRFQYRWFHLTHFFMFLLIYYFLLTKIKKIPNVLLVLLGASVILFLLADIFLMKMYFPYRYLRFSLPIFTALTGGYFWSMVIDQEIDKKIILKIKNRHFKITPVFLLTIALVVLGLNEFQYKLIPGLQTTKYYRTSLYEYLRSLPGRPLIVAHPYLASEIPIMTGKSVLISDELAHPWWSEYWKSLSNRTFDFFEAYYAEDSQKILQFQEKYKIDYWIIQPRHFSKIFLKHQDIYFEPFDRYIRKSIKPTRRALLKHFPRDLWEFSDGVNVVISKETMIQWLNPKYSLEMNILPKADYKSSRDRDNLIGIKPRQTYKFFLLHNSRLSLSLNYSLAFCYSMSALWANFSNEKFELNNMESGHG